MAKSKDDEGEPTPFNLYGHPDFDLDAAMAASAGLQGLSVNPGADSPPPNDGPAAPASPKEK